MRTDHDQEALGPGWRLREQRPLLDMLGEKRIGHGVLGVSDPDVFYADGRWNMLLGAVTTRFKVSIVHARLPVGANIDDDRWEFVTDRRGRAALLGAPSGRGAWDRGGMHTPSRVVGTVDGEQVERVYYAGQRTRASSGRRSRYAIGFLERGQDGTWRRHEEPVVEGDEQRPSVFEPFVLHTDGRWRMWFLSSPGEVGRGEQPDYQLRYTESTDGVSWAAPEAFASTEEGFFDNCVAPTGSGWRMILARGTNLHGTHPFPSQGLWITETPTPPAGRDSWRPMARLLNTDNAAQPWYAAGLCGPAIVDDEDLMHIFATGTYAKTSWWRLVLTRLRDRKPLPPPSPFYLCTGRLTFERSCP
ncbi:hypothetical protein DI005_31995 [Prauserella sp. PE36]|uniref:hypothetical protein n=1 Tax=Prauserella sp. PE36 TaxID=1504709 RepID=UPI000DE1E648|nr:hypothetical protein [Prauserella sp. PE36]RBM13050.1 hypothetical protein DI005_31995 [Prauserella sp. PE36]